MFNLQFRGNIVLECYSIAIKKGVDYELRYGQNTYDFDEGVMSFTSPNQVVKVGDQQHDRSKASGWILLIHPDFLWNSPLASRITKYDYFNYSVREALFLSEKEEALINTIIHTIQREYDGTIDKFSQQIITSQIETLLHYADRFYQRQFITRKILNHQVLDQFESLLFNYFNNDELLGRGLPTVQFIADKLAISPSYLGSLLKTLTGQNTQSLIQQKLLEKAKEKLSGTNLSVAEIAFLLGFEHPQSFNKLFKNKTALSPLEFRKLYN